MPRHWFLLAAVFVAALLLIAAESPSPVVVVDPVSASPVFQRVDLGPTDRVQRTITVHATTDLTVLAAESGCRCVAVTTPMPLVLKAGATADLEVTITGVLPGLKTIILRSTAGAVPIQVQVVSAGLGDGLPTWKALAARAVDQHLGMVVIVHDLGGAIRNCGCSGGSLGGIDHLAALPAALATWAPGVSLRFVLTGDAEGHRTGVDAALAPFGWKRDASIVVSANPERDVQDAALVAVISSVHTAINHRKLIHPVLTGGMTAEVLLTDAQGQIVEHETLPIDRTLPSDAAILDKFPDVLTSIVDALHLPAQSCLACHAAAHQTWVTSRHANAWASLKPEDRTDTCVTCHSTAMAAPEPTIAPGVQCQSCHAGADAHAAQPTLKTLGKTDCRSCHDARHDPSFDQVRAWAAVLHGK